MLTTTKQKAFVEVCSQHLLKKASYDVHQRSKLEEALTEASAALMDEIQHNLLNIGQVEAQKLYLKRVLDELAGLAPLLAPTNGEILELWMRSAVAAKQANGKNEAEEYQLQLPEEQQRWLAFRSIGENQLDIQQLYPHFEPIDWQFYQADLGTTALLDAWTKVGALYIERGGVVSSSPKGHPHRKAAIDAQVIVDITTYVPWVLSSPRASYPADADIFERWVSHLAGPAWVNYPFTRPWLAPIEYELEFFNGPDRGLFQAGIKRLLAATKPLLEMNPDDEQCWLFRNWNAAIAESKREADRRLRLSLARQNLKRLGEWLRLRSSPLEQQYLDALQTIWIVPAWTFLGGYTNKLLVACGAGKQDEQIDDQESESDKMKREASRLNWLQQDEEESDLRFQMLYQELRCQLVVLSGLPAFERTLRQITTFSTDKIKTYRRSFEDGQGLHIASLEAAIRPFYLFDSTGKAAHLTEVTDDFWELLDRAVKYRKKWAEKAYRLIDEPLAATPIETMKAQSKKPASQEKFFIPPFGTVQLTDFLVNHAKMIEESKVERGKYVPTGAATPGRWGVLRVALIKAGLAHDTLKPFPYLKLFKELYNIQAEKSRMYDFLAPAIKSRNPSDDEAFYWQVLTLLEGWKANQS